MKDASDAPRLRPWPGPRPYKEDEAERFPARDAVMLRLVDDIAMQLTVLSAASGSGKTSLLRAGVLPELREQRSAGGGLGPVFLLREWGAARGRNATVRIAHALLRELKAQAAGADGRVGLAAQDAELAGLVVEEVEAAGELGDLRGIVRRLREQFGSVVIVFDQFEELMGSATREQRGDQARQAAACVGRLYRDAPEAHLVVALRKEYCHDLLRVLNHYVRELHNRVIDLDPLPVPSLAEVLERGALAARVSVDGVPAVAERLGMLANDEEGVPLLQAQAVLWDFDAWCHRTRDELEVSAEAFDAYIAGHRLAGRGDADAGVDPSTRRVEQLRSVASSLLSEHVNEAVDHAAQRAVSKLPMTVEVDAHTFDQRVTVARWVLVQMLPRLASATGFKQHTPMSDLLTGIVMSVGRDFGVELGGGQVADHVRRWLDALASDESAEPELPWSDAPSQLSGAGIALDRPLEADEDPDPRAVLRALLRLAVAVVRELAVHDERVHGPAERRALLKVMGYGRNETVELIHDGFADPTRAWGERELLGSTVALGSPVVLSGRFLRLGQSLAFDGAGDSRHDVRGVRWVGCTVRGAEFRGVRFRDADMRGSVFLNCRFVDCDFQDCVLVGCVFKDDCRFERTRFRDVSAVSAFFTACTFIEEVVFEGSRLDQAGKALKPLLRQVGRRRKEEGCHVSNATFVDCTLSGTLVLRQAVVRFAQIGGMKGAREGGARLVFQGCDLMNSWIEDGGYRDVEIDHACRTIGLLTAALPPAAQLRRTESERRPLD